MHCVGFELALSSHPTSREKGGLLSAGLKRLILSERKAKRANGGN